MSSFKRLACWRGESVAATLSSLASALMAGTEKPTCAEGRIAERAGSGAFGWGRDAGSVASSVVRESPGPWEEGAGRPLEVEERSSEANDFTSGGGFVIFFPSVIVSADVERRVPASGASLA